MSQKNNKRLGRGLDSLIGGGLPKQQPPAIKIDNTRIERIEPTENTTPAAPMAPKAVDKNDLIGDLNELLKKTQAEAAAEMGANDFLKAEAQEEKPQPKAAAKPATPAPAKSAPVSNTTAPKAPVANTTSAAKVEGNPVNQQSVPGQGVFALIPLKSIKLSPYQRRKEFAPEALADLAASIRAEGLMQPIVVRVVDGAYELIAGERRLRACESIGMEVLPARVVSVANASAAVMGLIENLQRENLNPVEEAKGYGMLLSDFHMTQEQISERVGKARATVANSLRLLLLEPEILGYMAKGQLTMGHAKVLLGLQEGPQRVLLARRVVEEGLSVRQTEGFMRKAGNTPAQGSNTPTKRLASEAEVAVIADLQKRLVACFNTKVAINHSAKGGRMVIYYKNNAELEGVLKRIGLNS